MNRPSGDGDGTDPGLSLWSGLSAFVAAHLAKKMPIHDRKLPLPPLYEAVVTPASAADARSHARKLAVSGAQAGTFVWSDRDDMLDCALVLRPEIPDAGVRPVILVAALALSDAIGSVAEGAVPSELIWPGEIRLNRGTVAGVSLDLADTADDSRTPSWAVVSLSVTIKGRPGEEGGESTDRTSLRQEGLGDITSPILAEAFGRYFLSWMDQWENGGLAPIARNWMSRATSTGKDVVMMFGDELIAGSVEGLDESGGLVLETSQGRRVFKLAETFSAGRKVC